MLRFIGFLFLFIITCEPGMGKGSEIEKYAAIVIDADADRELESKNADKIRHPASLTKMMTLYIIFQSLKAGKIQLTTKIPVSQHASRQIPSKLGLRPGEWVSVETVIKGLVTRSANDAATAIGEYLGGTEERFAAIMTQKARALGMKNTVFKNASGVPNKAQVTTARDMAILSKALLRDFPRDYRHFSLRSFSYKGVQHRNHHHLLGKVNGVDGIKTGFVAASGFNLAASAVRRNYYDQPRRLIVVVLGGPSRHWRDRRVTELFERNFIRIGIGDPHISNVSISATPEEGDEEQSQYLVKSITHTKTPPNPRDVIPLAYEEEEPETPATVSPTISSLKTTVQLGSFPSKQEARRTAQSIFNQHKKGTIVIPTFVTGNKRLYAAQITNLSGDLAEKICAKVRENGQTCVIMECAPPSKKNVSKTFARKSSLKKASVRKISAQKLAKRKKMKTKRS